MSDPIKRSPERVSAKVVRLDRGRHRDPAEGVCIAELVSMLAEEPFSDHPLTACPALIGFLRGYNDGIPEQLRQDLYGLASDLVGSRSDVRTTIERARRIRAFGESAAGTNLLLRWRLRFMPGNAVMRCEAIGYLVAWRCRESVERHATVLAFVRELLGSRAPAVEPAIDVAMSDRPREAAPA